MVRWLVLYSMFAVLYLAGVLIYWRIAGERQRQRLVRNLSSKVDPDKESVVTTLLINDERAAPSSLAGFIARVAGEPNSKRRFIFVMVFSVFAGYFLGTLMTGILGTLAPYLGAILIPFIPWSLRSRAINKRKGAMEEQFPDALDFLARSVRAGNAFSISLELLGSEAVEPLKSEILKVTREMSLGASLEDALRGMIKRVPLFEVRYFVAAVLMQRETGGNLSEILGKLATSVRQRMQLRGHVRAASGQGRLTAIVLMCLPIATMFMLHIVSPAYMDAMTDDPLGRNLLSLAVLSLFVGHLVMQKVIKIEV